MSGRASYSTRLQFQHWPSTTKPWERIHVDFAGPFWGSLWMIVVDTHSKFPLIFNATGWHHIWTTIRALRDVFLLEGPLDTLVSDNGTQFTASRFKEICMQAGIDSNNSTLSSLIKWGSWKICPNIQIGNKEIIFGGDKQRFCSHLFTDRTMPSSYSTKSIWTTPLTLLHSISHCIKLNKNKFEIGDLVYSKIFSRKDKWTPGTIPRLWRIHDEHSYDK